MLSHFENERQWVDIARPVLSRMTGTIAELSKDKQIMLESYRNKMLPMKKKTEGFFMKWHWTKNQDKEIKRFLKHAKRPTNEECDFIANVRCGELCFDLVERETGDTDKPEYTLFADLYVGGINTGYGYGKNDYPYDFMHDVGCTWSISNFEHMTITAFKQFIASELTACIHKEKTAHGTNNCEHNLLEKANMPLHEWW